MNTSQVNGYSSSVIARLRIGSQSFEIASVGLNSCRLRSPESMPPSAAEIIVSIDGIEKSRPVFLTDGILMGQADVRFESRESECVD